MPVIKSVLSSTKIQGIYRVFGNKWLSNKPKKAEREERFQQMNNAFRDAALVKDNERPMETVVIAKAVELMQDNDHKRYGAVYHRNRPAENLSFSLKEDYKVEALTTCKENNPKLPLVLAAIKAIRATPDESRLTIVSRELFFIKALTYGKKEREGTDYVYEQSARAWRMLNAEINRRPGPTFVMYPERDQLQMEALLVAARSKQEESAELTLDVGDAAKWN
ncbi:hypothetical protein PENSPDRAFT_694620 [Peniophora sp. CONT]|nr:hypothetical protein PENSPDRAFT_694620 [Peniophora sp. CONT]